MMRRSWGAARVLAVSTLAARDCTRWRLNAAKGGGTALAVTPSRRRDVMEMHRLLGYSYAQIRRETAKATGIPLTGAWKPCEG